MERSTIKLLKKRGNTDSEIARAMGRDRKTVRKALVEPAERARLARSVGERIDYLTKKVELEKQIAEDEEMRRLLEEWRAKVVHKVEEETPERFVMNFTELLHGIWSRIGVEYPSSVKDLGRRELVKTLTVKQLEQLEETLRTTIEELEDFQTIINSELFSRGTKAR